MVSPVMGRDRADMAKPEVAIIFIRNAAGDFFVHQRLATKETFPNRYGLGAGGYVDAGETPHSAAQRELFEETGLETPVQHVCRLEFDDPLLSHRLAYARMSGRAGKDFQVGRFGGCVVIASGVLSAKYVVMLLMGLTPNGC